MEIFWGITAYGTLVDSRLNSGNFSKRTTGNRGGIEAAQTEAGGTASPDKPKTYAKDSSVQSSPPTDSGEDIIAPPPTLTKRYMLHPLTQTKALLLCPLT